MQTYRNYGDGYYRWVYRCRIDCDVTFSAASAIGAAQTIQLTTDRQLWYDQGVADNATGWRPENRETIVYLSLVGFPDGWEGGSPANSLTVPTVWKDHKGFLF